VTHERRDEYRTKVEKNRSKKPGALLDPSLLFLRALYHMMDRMRKVKP
jgi:hypothetical protein